jgi:hypothetical protein
MARRIDQDEAGQRQTHEHWATLIPRTEWHEDQCFLCRFYLPLAGPLGADWGACANPASPRHGAVTFEHDHCRAFALNDSYYDK